MTTEPVVYSARNRPDLTPVYRLYEELSETRLRVEKVYHWDVEKRVIAERNDPQADVLLTNSQLALETIRNSGVFDPYQAPVAREYRADQLGSAKSGAGWIKTSRPLCAVRRRTSHCIFPNTRT